MPKRSIPPQRGFFPQPVYLMGCFLENGKPNFTLVTWTTFCSAEPPMLMFTSGNARRKRTAMRILETGLFSANLVTTPMVEVADYCGNASGYKTDKCLDTGLSWSRGAVLDVPILDDSPWVFECSVTKTTDIGNGTVYFGEIRNILVDQRLTDSSYGKIDLLSVNPAIYSPTSYYSVGARIYTVGDSLKKYR
ncbi:MAG: flavin reductase family protein [Firmicutes bacterium]|nr:flavin reductase family protein [Bacillota bacterium]